MQLAAIDGALGEIGRGIAELEKSYRSHEGFLISIKVHPDLDPFRGDARFQAIEKKMGLE